MKIKISKEEFEKLPESSKEFYKEKDGVYLLDIDESEFQEQVSTLRNKDKQEEKERKRIEKELKERDDKIKELESKISQSSEKGDVKSLNESWEEKFTKMKTDYESKIAKHESFIKKTLVEKQAIEIDASISKVKGVLLPHIEKRLRANLDLDEPCTEILDSKGNLSAYTIADLKNEFLSNEQFGDFLIGSKASGGGTSSQSSKANASEQSQSSGKSIAEKLDGQFKEYY